MISVTIAWRSYSNIGLGIISSGISEVGILVLIDDPNSVGKVELIQNVDVPI